MEPVTLAWAQALAQGDDVFAERFGVPVEPGWSGFPEMIPRLGEAIADGRPAVWGSHLVFDDDSTLVGLAGWKGEPIEGVAELGYAVAPARRGRGIATAAVCELLARGRASGVRTAVAHTLPEESPSTSVLVRCGFTNVGEVVDGDEGVVWRWGVELVSGCPTRAPTTPNMERLM